MSQVQDSSDCCINSKYSCAQRGYFEDEYLSLFIRKLHPRSPIINRGYYIRFKAIEEVFIHWCSSLKTSIYEKYQIISLGAGYDSSYLRLKNNNKLPPGCHYVEIDFPNVLKKKLECIKKLSCLEELVASENLLTDPAIVFHSYEYSMLGVDLTDNQALQKYLHLIGIDYSRPTLFLSECSITYIHPKKSESLIVWIQRNFPHSTFVTYEQVYPDDAFGIIMRNHFVQVGCPLKSISIYPDEETQIQRFQKLKWSKCSAVTMYDFFRSLPPEEMHRVKRLELFDEYEMWHEKCHHYVLTCASQGMVSESLSLLLAPRESPVRLSERSMTMQKSLDWKSQLADEIFQRFGHQVVLLSSSLLVLSGGFGLSNKKHQKLGEVVLYHTQSKRHRNICDMGARMFHTMTKLSNNTIVLLGGRSSPKKVFEEVSLIGPFNSDTEGIVDESVIVSEDPHSPNSEHIPVCLSVCPQSMPLPTWRHSASLVVMEGTECVVVFGGCSLDHTATDKCFVLNSESWKWSEIKAQECTPSPRHSHSAATYGESCILITGGLSADETILQSVHRLDCGESRWSTLHVSGLFPRYSHTSHVWNDRLFLVGGITSSSHPKLGLGVVNLKTLLAIELLPPGQDPEYPILLSNHSSYCQEGGEIIVVGGGGNCFSFGTHFNKKMVTIDIPSLL